MLEPVIWEPGRWLRMAREKGIDFLEAMQRLWEDPTATLEQVGEAHGLSRERIRQLFRDLYGLDYGYVLKQKKWTATLQEPTPFNGSAPLGEAAQEAARRLEKLGLHAVKAVWPMGTENISKSLRVLGKTVVIRVAKAPTKVPTGTPGVSYSYYMFQQVRPERTDFDYYAFFAKDVGKFYVVPRKAVRATYLHIPAKDGGEYAKYLEAWEQLLPEVQVQSLA